MSTAPNSLRSNELPEFPMRGPFGGIQSELPPDYIEQYGFSDAINVMFRKGAMNVRPALNSVSAGLPNPQEPIVGVYDFFNASGIRVQTILTPTRLLTWNGSAWTQITGTLTGAASNLFSFASVGEKMCFGNGVDKVKVYDGIAGTFSDAAAGAVPAKYLFELDRHLLALNTIEAGSPAPQRVRWTGPGDPTDWTSLNAGQADMFNDLGPINGGIKLYQSGYIFHQLGITQANPTGNGLQPFTFVSMSAHSKGLIAPYSLAAFGETTAAYLGKDNVYLFDGTQSYPIGDAPLTGRIRLGARRRIFQDVVQYGNLNGIYGFISSGINGNDYYAYWLVIPGFSTWVYNFDEGNWTRFTWAKTPTVMGNFDNQGITQIQDLIGTIGSQNWSPATLSNANPLDSVFMGFNDGTLGLIDFTGVSEQPWSVSTGQMYFLDYRHNHTVKKVRVMYRDFGQVTFTISLTNDQGQVDSKKVTVGTGSGATITKVIEFSISGRFLTMTVSGAAGQYTGFTEITPIYDVAGEVRGG